MTEQQTQVPAALMEYGLNVAQLSVIKSTVAKNATTYELALYLATCKHVGANPMLRQLHFVKYGAGDDARMAIITGIDFYRLLAQRSGQYAGNADYLYDEGLTQFQHLQRVNKRTNAFPMTATATVHRLIGNKAVAFSATAGWDEYYPGEKKGIMWRKMPYLMLGKCAEALALRKGFPAELTGIYTKEEMAQAEGWDYAEPPSSDLVQAVGTAVKDLGTIEIDDGMDDAEPTPVGDHQVSTSRMSKAQLYDALVQSLTNQGLDADAQHTFAIVTCQQPLSDWTKPLLHHAIEVGRAIHDRGHDFIDVVQYCEQEAKFLGPTILEASFTLDEFEAAQAKLA